MLHCLGNVRFRANLLEGRHVVLRGVLVLASQPQPDRFAHAAEQSIVFPGRRFVAFVSICNSPCRRRQIKVMFVSPWRSCERVSADVSLTSTYRVPTSPGRPEPIVSASAFNLSRVSAPA